MIPIQDAVPSGKLPLVTIGLIVINLVLFAAHALADPLPTLLATSAFTHPTPSHFLINVLYLWLFGDNVEARVGRPLFFVLYVVCGGLGRAVMSALGADPAAMFMGATCAITGVLGAYSVLLPKSRVLMLVPTPVILAEAPVLFFLGLWWLLHVATFALPPNAQPMLLWPMLAAFAAGATMCIAVRRPVVWS